MARVLHTLSQRCHSSHRITFLVPIALGLAFFAYGTLTLKSQNLKSITGANVDVRELHGKQDVQLSEEVYPQPDVLRPARKDVLVLTPWLAPIVWDGTFNIDLLNQQFRFQNATIGLTVFAIKNYVWYLALFLESAETYFMVGHRVNYYVFTDQPDCVPRLFLQEGRQLVIIKAQSYERWQDISMRRMEAISKLSEQRFLGEVDYLVCADVDMKFRNHVGVEILSSLFGTLHTGFLGLSRNIFSYERRPESQAYIPEDEGDFYYTGSFFGGLVPEVYRLTKACHEAMMVDEANNIEAVWQDESYLNKHLLHYKPTKVLSSEYSYSKEILEKAPHRNYLNLVLRRVRFMDLPKNYEKMRNNAGGRLSQSVLG